MSNVSVDLIAKAEAPPTCLWLRGDFPCELPATALLPEQCPTCGWMGSTPSCTYHAVLWARSALYCAQCRSITTRGEPVRI